MRARTTEMIDNRYGKRCWLPAPGMRTGPAIYYVADTGTRVQAGVGVCAMAPSAAASSFRRRCWRG